MTRQLYRLSENSVFIGTPKQFRLYSIRKRLDQRFAAMVIFQTAPLSTEECDRILAYEDRCHKLQLHIS